jgi:signal transduction histidine kinase
MSRAETRPGMVNGYVFDRQTDVVPSSRSMEKPTAGIVHDLGNLIQVASSALNRMARDPGVSTTPALQPVVASARSALERAGALVRQTVGLAYRHQAGMELTNVRACLTELETLIHGTWEPNIRLEIRTNSDLPFAMCDRLGLQNAVLNLVFNARDSMPDGGLISIEASTVFPDPAATMIEVRVGDSGIGMTPDTMVRAFDPFFTTKGKGLGGIGLPMVKRFAEEHGGSVDVESKLGSGTTMILRLPAMQ